MTEFENRFVASKLCPQCGTLFNLQKKIPLFGSLPPARHVKINNGMMTVTDFCSSDCLEKSKTKPVQTLAPQLRVGG